MLDKGRGDLWASGAKVGGQWALPRSGAGERPGSNTTDGTLKGARGCPPATQGRCPGSPRTPGLLPSCPEDGERHSDFQRWGANDVANQRFTTDHNVTWLGCPKNPRCRDCCHLTGPAGKLRQLPTASQPPRNRARMCTQERLVGELGRSLESLHCVLTTQPCPDLFLPISR